MERRRKPEGIVVTSDRAMQKHKTRLSMPESSAKGSPRALGKCAKALPNP